jgi:hypothetical protein
MAAVDAIIGPDVFVNASVALGTPPDHVVQRILGAHAGETKTTPWVLARVEAMLANVPSFKTEAIRPQLDRIRSLVKLVDEKSEHPADAWERALVAAARAAAVKRVITDHPDLLDKRTVDGIEFVSSEEWLFEQALPPPPPPPARAR